MSDQDGTAGATESDQTEMLARDDLTSFIEIFDAHAAHLFDYCNGLLGDQEEAASATEVTLIAAQSILQDREKIRAWLFALARRECMMLNPERPDASAAESSGMAQKPAEQVRGDASDRTGDLAPRSGAGDADTEDLLVADIVEAGSSPLADPFAPLSALPQRQREALNLVYRHGIGPDDLATVLGVPPEEAQALLEAAEAEFGHIADAAPGSAGGRAEESKAFGAGQISGLPLATLPPSIWRHTATSLFESEFPHRNGEGSRTARKRSARSQRQPQTSAKGRNRVTIGAAALIPLAAGAAGLLYLTHHSGDASSPRREPLSAATPPAGAASSSRPAAASSHNTAGRGPARNESAILPAQPPPGIYAISPTPKPRPSPSASPSGTSGSPSPSTSLSASSSPSASPSSSPSTSTSTSATPSPSTS